MHFSKARILFTCILNILKTVFWKVSFTTDSWIFLFFFFLQRSVFLLKNRPLQSLLIPITKNIHTVLALKNATRIIQMVWKICVDIHKNIENTYINLYLWKDLGLSWNWKIHFRTLYFWAGEISVYWKY